MSHPIVQTIAAVGYVMFGVLIYAVLLAAAAYQRDWAAVRFLTFGAVVAWGSYVALVMILVRETVPRLYSVDHDGAIRKVEPPLRPWWLVVLDYAQPAMALMSIAVPGAYILNCVWRIL